MLVIEDDWFSAQEIVAAVHRAGGDVLGPFPCADDAATNAAARNADAALLDISLMEGTSFELARKLKFAGVPVVFHSDWLQSDVPADLEDLAVMPKVQGATKAMAMLLDRLAA